MNTAKLYVGNVSYTATEDGLLNFFSQAGVVAKATIIIDRNTGRSRGFGFVEMSSVEEAEKAIQDLDGKEFLGRALIVKEALPRQPRM